MMNSMDNSARIDYAVQLENVTFSYNENTTVLKNCTLRVKKGEIFALLGSNGCGKTTILKLILGRAKPAKGWIRVFGLRPGDKHSDIPGPGAGFMPQEISLFPEFTIEDNLKYFAKIFHLSCDEFEERFQHLTQLLNLCERHRDISELSGGQQRLVSLAVALIHKPRLIILDEPTVGVDPILRTKIWSYLEDICQQNGNTVIITTHYIEEAKRASIVGFMKAGALLKQSNPQKLMDEYQSTTLENVFLRLWRQNYRKHKEIEINSNLIPYISEGSEQMPNYSKTCLDIKRCRAIFWRFNLRVKKFPILALCFIALPFISLFSLHLSIGHLPHNIPVAAHTEESHHSLSNQFIDSIDTKFLDVMQYQSKESAADSLVKGKNIFALFFEPNFTEEFKSRLMNPLDRSGDEEYDSSIIKLHIDSSRAVVLALGLQYLADVFQVFVTNVSTSLGLNPNAFSLPVTIEQPIYGTHPITGDLRDRFKMNYDYLVPGFLLVCFHMSSMIFSAFVVINNRRGSQMNRYFVSGGQPLEMTVTHYVSIINYILVQIFLLLMCASFLFDIKQEGSYVEVYLICFTQSLQGLSIGLLAALIFSEEFAIGCAIAVLMLPVYFISGLFWPLEGIPSYFRLIADWTPLSKPIEALRCVMLRGWGFSHSTVWMGYLVNIFYTLVISLTNFMLFQHRQEPIF